MINTKQGLRIFPYRKIKARTWHNGTITPTIGYRYDKFNGFTLYIEWFGFRLGLRFAYIVTPPEILKIIEASNLMEN